MFAFREGVHLKVGGSFYALAIRSFQFSVSFSKENIVPCRREQFYMIINT